MPPLLLIISFKMGLSTFCCISWLGKSARSYLRNNIYKLYVIDKCMTKAGNKMTAYNHDLDIITHLWSGVCHFTRIDTVFQYRSCQRIVSCAGLVQVWEDRPALLLMRLKKCSVFKNLN